MYNHKFSFIEYTAMFIPFKENEPHPQQLPPLFSDWKIIDLVTVFDAILTSRQRMRNYSVCMRIQCRIISVKRLFWKKYEL